MMSKAHLRELIEQRKTEFEEISDSIWNFAELSFCEYKSSNLQKEFMQKEGFRITSPIANMKTAFVAEFGTGKPVIAILGEYDALPGLSQEANLAEKRSIITDGSGHGCGHNLLGTAGMEAACALKRIMQESCLKGTIRYYGCPAEEGGGGKVYMVKAGEFNDVDAALTWHPLFTTNQDYSFKAMCQVLYKFEGRAAHSIRAWEGRCALDAAELMMIGVQFLREHIPPGDEVQYAFTNAGVTAPNIVKPVTEVLYSLRSPSDKGIKCLYERLNKVAKGAAMMTETNLSKVEVKAAYSSNVVSDVLYDLMYENLRETGPVEYTKEEIDYAKKFLNTVAGNETNVPIDTNVQVQVRGNSQSSSDVCDVSAVVPVGQVNITCYANIPGLHTWQVVAQGKSSIAHKGMHMAAKVIGTSAFELLTNKELLERAKAEHLEKRNGSVYSSLLPDDKKPST